MNKKQFLLLLTDAAKELSIGVVDVERALANFIVAHAFFRAAGEMDIAGFVKGGTAQIWRLGIHDSRQTRDIDIVVATGREETAKVLSSMQNLQIGEFSIGRTSIQRDRTTIKVPADYRIVVAKVQLKIENSSWLTCDLEILPLEGQAQAKSETAHPDLQTLIKLLGFAHLTELPVISVELQIAEKLHAVTEPGSERATDLLDIAKAVRLLPINSETLRLEVRRVFERRGTHVFDQSWAPSEIMRLAVLQIANQAEFEASLMQVSLLLENIGKPQ